MSVLKKFEPTESWRLLVKDFLLAERKVTPQQAVPRDTNRFSLDIRDDFIGLLEEKQIPKDKLKILRGEQTEEGNNMWNLEENKENQSGHGVQSRQKLKPTKTANTVTFECSKLRNYDDTMCEGNEARQFDRISDESFEAMERMCDKTASDPNSTLFNYLHSENRKQVVEAVKHRYSDEEFNKEMARIEENASDEDDALNRLLKQLNVEEQTCMDIISPLAAIEVTQIEDIEAPSRLWENTIAGDTMMQTSPVKMVGLLRPSTIIEECVEESNCTGDSSQNSFKSGLKTTAVSEISSSCYETAPDTTATSCINQGKVVPETSESSKCHSFQSSTESDATYGATLTHQAVKAKIELESSFQEKDLSLESDTEDSIIEIPSEDDDADCEAKDIVEFARDGVRLPSFNAETVNKQHGVENIPLSIDESLDFNDTLEQVEYLMKKGQEFMAAAATATTNGGMPIVKVAAASSVDVIKVSTATKQPIKQNTFLITPKRDVPAMDKSPIKPTLLSSSRGKLCQSPQTKSVQSPNAVKMQKPFREKLYSPKSGSKTQNNGTFHIKTFPKFKLDVFPKPHSTVSAQAARNQKQFSHIVSPIGAYMKNTATTPLMATMKCANRKPDLFNSSAIRSLEKETRSYQPKFGQSDASSAGDEPRVKLAGVPNNAKTLPKKAYISSQLKHIVDERTKITIPGGKTIQKYLEPAKLPTIVRHEGKLKINNQTLSKEKPGTAHVHSRGTPVRRADGSLANLSVMSGDVSVYTLRDARNFKH